MIRTGLLLQKPKYSAGTYQTIGLRKSVANSLYGLQSILMQVTLFEVLADVVKFDGYARVPAKVVASESSTTTCLRMARFGYC